MVKYRAYFDIPNDFRHHCKGSSPQLTDILIKEIKGAKKVFISFFLFNNPAIINELEKIVNNGGTVKIYSLPLNGYDQKAKKIYNDNYSESFYFSKLDYAQKYIYPRIESNPKDIEMKIFPHTYVWFKQKFSRGNESYSLHNKSVLAEFDDCNYKCISSSSNFALGDPRHSENMMVVEECKNTTEMFKMYFELLDKNSVNTSNYFDWSKKYYDFQYVVKPIDIKINNLNCYFTAPFIKYNGVGSNHFVQSKIIEFILKARSKIFICAQHFSDVNPFDKNARSIVRSLEKVIIDNPDIEVKILKQTRPENQAQGARTRITEAFFNDFPNVEQKFWSPVIHDKFIVVDNEVLVTTANFTPTQYAWSVEHPMKYEIYTQNGKETKVVYNTFSEINSFHIIDDSNIAVSYEDHFKMLWEKATLIKN
ncbi:hypothetical protein HPT25_01610 [Bacillus sp. BRMEA1]|uniref:hypothetical protein n=1 Tax=Neobacillus endophyticus TaxID=2738405 RepID=UPI00156356F8|nr:hypothetical protein [Neobacillus endophyticus]NRD76205.1 hypothetical protein [Neobacillus endophyticus]